MNDYFCGWYFKCQSNEKTLAIIPAVHASHGKREASVQLISKAGNWNIPIHSGNVRISKYRPRALLENNLFCEKGIRLDLHTPDCSASGRLYFGPPSPIRYDIMGPFALVPFLECRHNVFSMCHRVRGSVTINGDEYSFRDGTGYIEGDSGSSFPKRYAWTQCSFANGSVMLSVADVPLGPVCFTGVIAVIQDQEKEYRLASYLGAKAVEIHDGSITIRQGDLELTARLIEKSGCALRAPLAGKMSRTIHENVSCRAQYRLSRKHKVILEWESSRASFEYEYPF